MRDFRNGLRYRPDVNPVRQAFQGYVNFIFNRSLFGSLFGEDDNGFRSTISSLVVNAELPSANFKTETLNEYNRKRIVNTGVEYNPVNINVYDTVNNEWLSTIMKYFAYHYMNPRNEQAQGDRDMQKDLFDRSGSSALEMAQTAFGRAAAGLPWDSNAAGYNPNVSAHFFERIDYVLYHNNRGVQYSLFNPVMTSFKPGTIDYSDSQALQFALTFEYESFTTYNVANFQLSDEDRERFENGERLNGPSFAEAPPVAVEKDLSILGNTTATNGADRQRTGQIGPNRENLTPPTPDRFTYSEGSTTGGGAPDVGGVPGFLGDLIDDVATTAINGGDVRDAAIRRGVGGLTGIINRAFNNDSDAQANDAFINGDQGNP